MYPDKNTLELSWKPNYAKLKAPIYSSIACQLRDDILSGALPPNTQLPTQRDLAERLNVNLSTITRAFKLCEAKGLIYATTGCGTFVSPDAGKIDDTEDNKPHEISSVISMGSIKPFTELNSIIAEAAKEILSEDTSTLFDIEPFCGSDSHRQIAHQWLHQLHVDIKPDNIMITSGAQSSLQIALMTLFKPGDTIAADTFTYSNFIMLAKQFNLHLIAVTSDLEGMIPEELSMQCKIMNIKGIFLMPSCCNPTSQHMSLQRRRKIADVIRTHNLMLIEDDTYNFLYAEPIPPIMNFIPESTVYIMSLGKCLSPGLRTAYMVCPEHMKHMFLHTAFQLNHKLSSLNVEIVSRLIKQNNATQLTKSKQEFAKVRNHIFHRYFPDTEYFMETALFQWISLPDNCNGYQFEVQAKDHKVQILCSDHFAIQPASSKPYIRIATCSPVSDDDLEAGLKVIKDLIDKNRAHLQHPDYIE